LAIAECRFERPSAATGNWQSAIGNRKSEMDCRLKDLRRRKKLAIGNRKSAVEDQKWIAD
jgi:hypothetical protein